MTFFFSKSICTGTNYVVMTLRASWKPLEIFGMCFDTLHGGLLPAQKRTVSLGPLSALCSSVFSDNTR